MIIVTCSLNSISNIYNEFSQQKNLTWLQDLIPKQMKFKNLPTDSSGQYKIEANFLLSKIRPKEGQHDVTLVTHCTSNHLHYLLDLTLHWKGPVSLGECTHIYLFSSKNDIN